MAEFYIPAYSKKEGFSEVKWQSFFGSERPIECDENGKIWDGWKSYQLGKSAFTTKEEAIAASKEMRKKKIESLRKQISKLESFG